MRNFLEGVTSPTATSPCRSQGTSARIEHLTARAGSGTLSLSGDASLGETPQAQLKLKADRFQVLGRVDRRIVASGNAQVRLGSDTLAVDGKFTSTKGLIDFTRGDAPTLGDDVAGRAAQGRCAADAGKHRRRAPGRAGPPPRLPRRSARSPSTCRSTWARSCGSAAAASTPCLRGNLHITSPDNRLAVNGTLFTVDGTYAAYGQKLSIDRGQLTFNGDVASPRLDIQATRPDLDIRVGVTVTGTALNPADPAVLGARHQRDGQAQLAGARTRQRRPRSRRHRPAAARRTGACSSGEGGGGSDQITRALGLDDLSIRQSDGEVSQTIVSLGKQLSQRWYIGYEQGLNATGGNWQLIYRIARRFTLRAQAGSDNAVDLIWTWRWQ